MADQSISKKLTDQMSPLKYAEWLESGPSVNPCRKALIRAGTAMRLQAVRIEQLESERREIEALADGWHGTRPTTNTGYATGTHFANELRAILNK